MELWKNEAISPSHANFIFSAPDTSGMMYNIYADKLLRLGLVPDSVYDLLTSYYQTVGGLSELYTRNKILDSEVASKDAMKYGIPINNSPSQNTTTSGSEIPCSLNTH